jgi:dimethylamine/trimethylamine dehydrogenase
VLNRGVAEIAADHVVTNCVYTGKTSAHAADAVVMVASRTANDGLYHDLLARQDDWADADIRSVKVFGDAEAAGPIAWATYAGHRYARELDEPDRGDALSFRREITELAAE